MHYQVEHDQEPPERPSYHLITFDQYDRLDGLQESYPGPLCSIVELLNAPSPDTSSWLDRPSCQCGRNCRHSPSIQKESFHVHQQFVNYPHLCRVLDHAAQILFSLCACDGVFGTRAEFHCHLLFLNDRCRVLMVAVLLFEKIQEFFWL